MTLIVTAVIAVLSAQTALAEQRENKAFTTVNGRTAVTATAAPRFIQVTTPGGGISANVETAAPAPAATARGVKRKGKTAKGGKVGKIAGSDGGGARVPRNTPENGRTNTLDAGDILIDGNSRNSGNGPGLIQGTKDTAPPPSSINSDGTGDLGGSSSPGGSSGPIPQKTEEKGLGIKKYEEPKYNSTN